ncbi:IDEAL domain-containing protein [Neobacillus sp. DY30]|uniref:IDEAL domain-containing protein n=1 Tax=Neobacillus sp. DY30 TaxID=3047871 RepID=UPI0024BFA141|nr:IDEAL domain-containing protein [Neobacillus sp. DY30]WHY03151.1 IDEAL domain-containing protein [Neobacillus sp. DY30]
MLNNNHFPILEIGDWVKGNLHSGELIIGYVESLSNLEGVAKVTIVTSDNKDINGRTIALLTNQLKRLPAGNVTNKEQILFLIDLALSTGDEEWFNELSAKLHSINQLVKEVNA